MHTSFLPSDTWGGKSIRASGESIFSNVTRNNLIVGLLSLLSGMVIAIPIMDSLMSNLGYLEICVGMGVYLLQPCSNLLLNIL